MVGRLMANAVGDSVAQRQTSMVGPKVVKYLADDTKKKQSAETNKTNATRET